MATITSTKTVALRKREEVAEGTMAFHFDKPAGFEFRPGHAIDWTLLNPPETDGEGNTRAFSIASAPFDPDLMIATRLRDTAFKRVLRSMPFGAEVRYVQSRVRVPDPPGESVAAPIGVPSANTSTPAT